MKKGKWKQLAAVCTAAAAVMGLTLPAATVSAQEKTERLWDFCDGTQGWVYDDSWKGDCEVTGGASYDAEKGMLKVDVDFTAEQDNGFRRKAGLTIRCTTRSASICIMTLRRLRLVRLRSRRLLIMSSRNRCRGLPTRRQKMLAER